MTVLSNNGFMVRAGCSCNPGACHTMLGLNEYLVELSAMKKSSCGDENDMMGNHPLGAVRTSMGYITTFEEVDKYA